MNSNSELKIHYEVEGTGPPVVFIHGLGATSNVWYPQRVALRHNYQVIVYDRSGCGRSQLAREGYSIDGWADELARLLDELEVPAAVVVGHSLGSMVAQRFAARHAECTRALVLVGAEAVLPPAARQILTDRAALIEANGLLGAADFWLQAVLSSCTRESNPALTGLRCEMFLGNDPASYAAQSLVLRDATVERDQEQIRCPTLLLTGDQDPVTPLDWQQRIAAGIGNSAIRIVPNSAHMAMLESPGIFNMQLLEFLAGLEC